MKDKYKYSDIHKNRNKQLDKLQSLLKIKFRDKQMLNEALIHRSYLNENHPEFKDNERLEYLGDSVLALVVNEYLFKRFADYHEGELAKIKAVVVSEEILSMSASRLNLGSFLLMGRGEELNGGRERASILANTLEAVIGAYYLDSGLKAVRGFILGFIKEHIERTDSMTYQRDPKTALQEYVQKKYKERPEYLLKTESGPDHNKRFGVALLVKGREISFGTGSSKRKAEMEAASTALKKIEKGDGF